MGKILNLRKKPAKAPQSLQKPREEVGVDPERSREGSQRASASYRALQEPVAAASQSEASLAQKGREPVVEKPEISWEAPSFYYNPQKRYLSMVIIALLSGAAALLIFRYNSLTSIFLILSSLVLILYSKQKPTVSKITVDQSGVSVDDIVYHYNDLKSFWIEYNPGGPKELSLESAKWYMPYIKVLLNEQNPVEVRSLIINFLPEKEHENSLVDHIGRRLGL